MSVKPQRLRQGHEIGIIAPAGPVNQSEIQPAIDLLVSAGYGVVLASHLFHRDGYTAGDDDARLEDLHSMFHNEDVRVIFCARGGYGTLRLLDRIDYDLIRSSPKIFVGYSDITALLLAIYKKTGLITFHGPVVKEFTKNSNRNLNLFFDLVSSKEVLRLDLSGGTALLPGKTRGNLLGGNLSLITRLIGTPFMPSMRGALLFIEETGEPLYRVDRMLTHLKLSGLLNEVAGLITGRFIDCGDISDINHLITDTVSDFDFPVVSGLPVGHGTENVTLPLGLQADLDTDHMTLSFVESHVSP
ncbi:MAG: LD-carboxypeptidase [Desulfobacteraceae bacterium]|nr:LD-carboxypeptidase [Desulfobacteraceae bacterium]